MHYCAKKEKYVLLVLHLQFQAYYSITHWGHEILEKKFDFWAVTVERHVLMGPRGKMRKITDLHP